MMLQANNGRRRISVGVKLQRFVLNLILSDNSISIRFKLHPRHYYHFKLKSKPTRSKFLAIFKPKKGPLHSPCKHKYLKGRTIWVIAIIICFILITLLWKNRLFTLKFIYNYAISSGLIYDIYQALLNRIFG